MPDCGHVRFWTRKNEDSGETRVRMTSDLTPSDSGPTRPLGWALSTPGAELYDELLSQGELVEDDAAGAFGRPAVEELVARGFAVHDSGPPALLIPLPPEVPLVRTLAAQTQQWLDSAPDATSISEDLRRYSRAEGRRSRVTHSPERGLTVTELPARSERAVSVNSVMTSARTELWIMQSSRTPDDPPPSDEVVIAPEDLLARGVAIRFLYDPDVLEDVDFLRAAMEEAAAGVEARVAVDLPSDFAIADRARLFLTTSYSPMVAIYSESASLIDTLRVAFESIWDRATPLGHASWNEATAELSESHRIVLSLVVNGLGNDAIGRSLHINSRTVRRRVDELLTQYGVTNRSALIAAAVLQTDQRATR